MIKYAISGFGGPWEWYSLDEAREVLTTLVGMLDVLLPGEQLVVQAVRYDEPRVPSFHNVVPGSRGSSPGITVHELEDT